MRTCEREDGMIDVLDDKGTVVAVVAKDVLPKLEESLLSRAMLERSHSIGSRVVNDVTPEQREARRGKPVPGGTGWLWCSHCGGHMVSPKDPSARCKKCRT